MTQRAIWLFFIIGSAPDGFKFIEVICSPIGRIGHFNVPFSVESGAVAALPEEIRGEGLGSVAPCRLGVPRGAVTAARETGQDGCATHPTDRLTHEGV